MPDDTPPQPELFSSFDDAWRAFLRRDASGVASNDMPAFAQGRAQFLAFIARIEDAHAREHLARVNQRVASIPGLEPFPDSYWHITIKGVGFQVIKRSHDDDIMREDVSRLASRAKGALDGVRAFDVQLGPPNAFPDAVILEAHDGGAALALNEALAGLEGVARYPSDGEGYLPHVSIAQFTSGEGIAQLKAALTELRGEGPGPGFPVRRIELVKAWLSEDVPEFDTLATYTLAPQRSLGGAP